MVSSTQKNLRQVQTHTHTTLARCLPAIKGVKANEVPLPPSAPAGNCSVGGIDGTTTSSAREERNVNQN